MPEWLRALNERDRDIYEAELLYDAWLEREQLLAIQVSDELDDDSFDERDPYDRLKSEGGHLSE